MLIAAAALAAACRPHDSGADVSRGPGLHAADLPVASRAEVYRAALAAAFDLTDPDLTLLLDPRVLPRTAGFGPGGRMPPSLVDTMRARRIIQGVCEPPIIVGRKEPRCEARGAGYLVRFTEVLLLAADSMEVYLDVQRFDLPSTLATHYFRFERAYQLTGAGESWRAAREGRVPDPPSRTD